MATNSVLIPVVGSTNSTPTQFTAASPSFNRYFTIPNTSVKYFGDYSLPVGALLPPNGINPVGFLRVEHHSNNQWITEEIYTSINGAAIATLFG